jgi:prevent-host-death family protein
MEMHVGELTVMASRFKAECLALLDKVERTGVSIVVTKHGRPVARLVPLDEGYAPRETHDSVRLLVVEDEAYYGTGETWDVDRSRT